MSINQELLAILACPNCRGEVLLQESSQGLVCNSCRLCYPIEEEIPVMLVEEAKKLDEL